MLISADSNPVIASILGQDKRKARGLEFALDGNSGSFVPEQTETEIAAQQSSGIKSYKPLSEDDKARLEYLQSQLESLLQDMAENPSEEKKGSIREIEAEIEKITGVKVKSRLSEMTAKIPKKKNEDQEDDEEERRKNMVGMNPTMLQAAIAEKTLPGSPPENPEGVMTQMMRAAGAYMAVSQADLSTSGKSFGLSKSSLGVV